MSASIPPYAFFLYTFVVFPCLPFFSANHDPPLKLYGVPARYANATYTAASKAGELEIVQRDLDAFQNVRSPAVLFGSRWC